MNASTPRLFDDALIADALRLLLDHPMPIPETANVLAVACIVASAKNPEWARAVAESASPEVHRLGERILERSRVAFARTHVESLLDSVGARPESEPTADTA